MYYLEPVAFEVWHRKKHDLAAIIVGRTESGVHEIWTIRSEDQKPTPALAKSMAAIRKAVEGLAELFDSDQPKVDSEMLCSIGLIKQEMTFAMEAAARKHLTRMLKNRSFDSWDVAYHGKWSVLSWEKRERLEALQKRIAAHEDDNAAMFDGSDADFAARRKRKKELRRMQRELSQMQGGTSGNQTTAEA